MSELGSSLIEATTLMIICFPIVASSNQGTKYKKVAAFIKSDPKTISTCFNKLFRGSRSCFKMGAHIILRLKKLMHEAFVLLI